MLLYLYFTLRLLNKLTSEMGDFFTDAIRDSNSHSYGRTWMCHHRIVVVVPSAQRLIIRWLSLTLPQRPPSSRTSPPSLHVRECVRIYISQEINSPSPPCHTLAETKYNTYISQQINSPSPSCHTLAETKYHSPWFTVPVVMSHSIQFHCVCFHFSTVSKREPIWHNMSYERGTCSKSSPIFCFFLFFVCCRCLIWFLRKIRKNSIYIV